MNVRLLCPRCSAALVPTWSGLRCPRLTACGRGGIVERADMPQPLADLVTFRHGVRA